jgi:hypothetical protein
MIAQQSSYVVAIENRHTSIGTADERRDDRDNARPRRPPPVQNRSRFPRAAGTGAGRPRRDEKPFLAYNSGRGLGRQPWPGVVGGGGADSSYLSSNRARQAEILRALLPCVGDIRRPGSAAVSLCWVACGRLDAFYEKGLQPWDYAAGALIASEAGADVVGAEDSTMDKLVVASAPSLTAQLHGMLPASA